ncbi:MAG: hypothetical protein J6Y27_05145 [Bacteroidales bacterium]|nr:hypothetical protein [Bacteroidales bacterium]
MKLSQDQKRMLRASALYPPCYAAGLILYNLLFKKEFYWGDILALFLGGLLLSAIFALFTIFGARIPTRDTPATDVIPSEAKESSPVIPSAAQRSRGISAPDSPAPDVISSAPPVIPNAAQESSPVIPSAAKESTPVIPSAAQRSRGISAPTPPDAAPSRTQDN